MADRSYIGIDGTGNNEWMAVFCSDQKTIFSGPFNNTPAGLNDLVRFIALQGKPPKICVRLANASVFDLIHSLSRLPDAEVVLISDAGFKMHKAWLSSAMKNQHFRSRSADRAYWLACCAGRVS